MYASDAVSLTSQSTWTFGSPAAWPAPTQTSVNVRLGSPSVRLTERSLPEQVPPDTTPSAPGSASMVTWLPVPGVRVMFVPAIRSERVSRSAIAAVIAASTSAAVSSPDRLTGTVPPVESVRVSVWLAVSQAAELTTPSVVSASVSVTGSMPERRSNSSTWSVPDSVRVTAVKAGSSSREPASSPLPGPAP